MHQAYGRNYQLPNVTAHNETCAAIGNVLWNWRMFLATGEAQYVDVLELALYNAVLSGVSLDGTNYFYVNPLRQVEPLPTKLRWSRTRVPFVTSYCCPPNVLADDCRSRRLCVQQDGRCGLDESLRRQHAVDDARRQAAEADAEDELSVGRPRANHGRRMSGRPSFA